MSEIMSNSTSAVMLFAPIGSGKADFLTELSCRYHTVYWFSPLDCEMSLFVYNLINKVMDSNDDALAKKLRQLLYCRSQFNDESVVITAVLDYISNIRVNCIMIFEHMECLPENFKLSILQRIIKHCPSNLKIVVSSNEYINLDFMEFDPLCPKLIDEDIMGEQYGKPTPEGYLEFLSPIQKAFLTYISDVRTIDMGFISKIYDGAQGLMTSLGRNGYYVTIRDRTRIHLSLELTDYLKSERHKYTELIQKLFPHSLIERIADYKVASKEYFSALRLYASINKIDKCNESIKLMLRDEDAILMALDFALSNSNITKYPQLEYPYWSLSYTVSCEARNDTEMAYDLCSKLLTIFHDTGDILGEMITLGRMIQIAFKKKGDTINSLKSSIVDAFNQQDPLYVTNRSLIFKGILEFKKELHLSTADIDELLDTMARDKWFQYIKNIEIAAYSYFDIGRYKKAIELTSTIKSYFPYYVIPHKFIAFKYYAGDVDVAENMVQNALKFALENNISEDIGLLYCTMATIDIFRGRIKDAFQKYDKAVTLDKTDSYAKFFNITKRCSAYSRFKSPYYSKEIAHIYLKYCRTFAPEFEHMILPSVAFAYYKLEDYDKAVEYAKKGIESCTEHTTYWLICMAMLTVYEMQNRNLKDFSSLVQKILAAAYTHGMDMIIIDYYEECFEPLITYAQIHKIEEEYVNRILEILQIKTTDAFPSRTLKVTMFGTCVQMYADGKEVLWRTRKAKELFLHYLMTRDAGVDRNSIVNFFWKDYLYNSAINNLKTTNNIIRNTLKQYGVDCDLKYTNSKYVLKIDDVESDYFAFIELKNKYSEDLPITQRIKIVNSMLKLYKGEFAEEINSKEFIYERRTLKQSFILTVIKLMRLLTKEGDYLEAKRLLSHLVLIDKQNDYTHMLTELDSHILLSK
jgi:DNA-binding SARP family transcriptional activator